MNNTTLAVIGALVAGLILGGIAVPRTFPGMMKYDMGQNVGMRSNIDRHFIEQMIPHHEGAIAMAQLALQKSTRPEILSLANGIIEAQTREINDMKTWYESWFGAIPATSSGHGMHMQGMEGDLDRLQSATNFDQEFLRQMIVHHEMAVMMAQMLASGTERSEMKTLADQIITSQNREIQTMNSWLKAWWN